jgi:O-succinylbenzoic acid--CoA ligase
LVRKAGCAVLISDDESMVDSISPASILTDPDSNAAADLSARLRVPLHRPATIIFTSGSSGRPKAALHTYGNHYYSALGSAPNIPLAGGDRWLLSLPLYHVGGLSILFRSLLAGATIAIPERGASLGHSISTFGITHVSVVATQLRRLLREHSELDTTKAILLGGGPVPDSLIDESIARGLPIHTSYGLTEMASRVTTTPPRSDAPELRTAGSPLPYRELSISGEGEILVRGETLFRGYIEEDGLEPATDELGWFHTGDLGELNAQGCLRVVGRRDNLFVSGGENVQPEEIENALERLEVVERAVVTPAPDAEFGERPVAFVRVVEERLPPDQLSAMLGDELPRFKIPIAFYEWPEGADPGQAKVDRPFFKALALRMREET